MNSEHVGYLFKCDIEFAAEEQFSKEVLVPETDLKPVDDIEEVGDQ